MYHLFSSFDKKEKFLCEVIRHKAALKPKILFDFIEELGLEQCFKICSENNVLDISAGNLLSVGIEIPEQWKYHYYETSRRIEGFMLELDKVASLFFDAGIKMVALKNSGICRGIYRHNGLSPMGDLDVLVLQSQFFKAHSILVHNGYVLKFRSNLENDEIQAAAVNGSAEYYRVLPSGDTLWFELQSRAVAGRWIQKCHEPNTEDLMARAAFIDGSKAVLLQTEDNLLQVCLHTAKHSYVRSPGFRLHTDVDRIVRSGRAIDWDCFLQRVAELKVKTPCFFSLYLAKEVLQTPIPKDVLTRLQPPNWKFYFMLHSIKSVGVFNPEEKKWNSLTYIIFVLFLFDDLKSLWHAIFPAKEDLAFGGDQGIAQVFLMRCKRLCNLLFKRTLS